jgi:hypothetical protein
MEWNDYSYEIVNPLLGRDIFLGIIIPMRMTNLIDTGIAIPLKNEWNNYFLWNGIDFSKKKTLYYFLVLHFVFLHFLTLQTMHIFPDLTLFLFSLSQDSQHDRPSPTKVFIAGHHVEALPPRLHQPCLAHPHQARLDPPERLLRYREATVCDPRCSHGRQHPRQQQTSLPSTTNFAITTRSGRTTPKAPQGSTPRCSRGGATNPRSCRGWPASQWGCRAPL